MSNKAVFNDQEESICIVKSHVKRLLGTHVIRYGMVGGIGIPVNDLALFAFTHLLGLFAWAKTMTLFGHVISPKDVFLYPLASASAFELSNIVNFILNQIFTYREQLQHVHGWEWVRRAAKGQLTSLSAMLLSFGVALFLVDVFHVDQYFANPAGIIIAFAYNFFISKKLVFRSIASPSPTASTNVIAIEDMETSPIQAINAIETITTIPMKALKRSQGFTNN